MKITDFILSSVKNFLNIDAESTAFDGEILPLILSSVGKLSQNGIVKATIVDSTTTWETIINPLFLADDEVFTLIPAYVMLSVKMLFDPPPPSTIQYYQSNLDDNLWRLKLVNDITKMEGE